MVTVDDQPVGPQPGGYGQTEVHGDADVQRARGGAASAAHGRPSPMVQVRIVDPDGNEVPPGETGEIVARGPTVMNGYWNRPELNAERRRGGWHHTNDLGRREPTARSRSSGRRRGIIKSAAENIYPAEVEGCLGQHPAVEGAAVIGVPDPTWTQSVKAIVVLHPDGDGHRRRASSSTAARTSRRTRSRGRSSSSTRSPAPGWRSTTTRSTRSSAAAATRRKEPRAACEQRDAPVVRLADPTGRYRRRIRLVTTEHRASSTAGSRTTSTTSRSTVRHDGDGIVTARRCVRAPLAVDDVPDAAAQLRALDGHGAVAALHRGRQVADPRMNCTHQFDLAGLCVAHAGVGDTRREYDVEVPPVVDGATHAPPLARRRAACSSGRSPGSGFTRRSSTRRRSTRRRGRAGSSAGPTSTSTTRRPRRRSCCVGRARSAWAGAWTSRRYDTAADLGPYQEGICYAQQPGDQPGRGPHQGHRSATSPTIPTPCSPRDRHGRGGTLEPMADGVGEAAHAVDRLLRRRHGENTMRVTPSSSHRCTSSRTSTVPPRQTSNSSRAAPVLVEQLAQAPDRPRRPTRSRGSCRSSRRRAGPRGAARPRSRRRRGSAATAAAPAWARTSPPSKSKNSPWCDDLVLGPEPLADLDRLVDPAAARARSRAPSATHSSSSQLAPMPNSTGRPRRCRGSAPRARRRTGDAGRCCRRGCRGGCARCARRGTRGTRTRRRPAWSAAPAGASRPGCGERAHLRR